MIDSLLEFGVAINFFGNYQAESEKMSSWASGFAHRMTDIGAIIAGIGLGSILANFGSNIYKAGMQMEGAYAGLKSILGKQERVLEALSWAQKKGLETPFTTTQVLGALTTLTTTGFAITKELREKSFDAFSDLASAFPDRVGDISNAATMVSKAAMGNWEHLADNVGIRANNIKQISQQILSQKLDTNGLKATMGDLEKYFNVIKNGTKGTTEYKEALVNILGTVFKGANAEKFNTLSGALSNFTDISERFFQKIAGFSQQSGDFFNAIKETFKSTIYGQLEKKYTSLIRVYASSAKELEELQKSGAKAAGDGSYWVGRQVSALDKLNNIATNLGGIFTSLWATLDSAAGGITARLVDYIDRVDKYFEDYKNKVAPFILFLYLVKLQVVDFFKGLADGFKSTFGFFYKFAGFILEMYSRFFSLFSNENRGRVYSMGAAIGHLLAAMMGMKVLGIVMAPLRTAFTTLMPVVQFFRGALEGVGEALAENGVAGKGLKYFRGGLSSLVPILRAVGAAAMANPLVLIIAAVAAALFLVWTYWDEIKKSVDNLSPSVVKLFVLFNPILGIPLLLIRHWDEFKTGFINIWEGIKGFLSGTWSYIQLEFMMKVDLIVGLWGKVKNAFTRFVTYIKTEFPAIFKVFEGIGKFFSDYILGPLEKAWDYISKIWDKVGDGIMWVWNNATAAFGEMGKTFGENADKSLEEYKKKRQGENSQGNNQYNAPAGTGGSTGYMPTPQPQNTSDMFKTISVPSRPAQNGTTNNDQSIGYNIQNVNLHIKADKSFDADKLRETLQTELRQVNG